MKKLLVVSLLFFATGIAYALTEQTATRPDDKTGTASTSEQLTADTPKTTVMGNAFVAPKDWSVRVQGPATIVEAPEGDSSVALVDVAAKSPERH
jgi:hypothetical protein